MNLIKIVLVIVAVAVILILPLLFMIVSTNFFVKIATEDIGKIDNKVKHDNPFFKRAETFRSQSDFSRRVNKDMGIEKPEDMVAKTKHKSETSRPSNPKSARKTEDGYVSWADSFRLMVNAKNEYTIKVPANPPDEYKLDEPEQTKFENMIITANGNGVQCQLNNIGNLGEDGKIEIEESVKCSVEHVGINSMTEYSMNPHIVSSIKSAAYVIKPLSKNEDPLLIIKKPSTGAYFCYTTRLVKSINDKNNVKLGAYVIQCLLYDKMPGDTVLSGSPVFYGNKLMLVDKVTSWPGCKTLLLTCIRAMQSSIKVIVE